MSPMDHEEMQASLGAYVIGAMPPDEIAEVRAHISTCESCMREADASADAAASLAVSVGTTALPPGFSERVLRTIREEREEVIAPPKPPRRAWLFAVAGAAAVALVIIGSLAALIATRSDLARAERILTAVLHDEGLELRGASGAVGKVVSVGDGSIFAATGLQEAPRGHDYQLWFIDDGRPRSAGTFEVRGGIGILEVDLRFAGHDAAAVTIELEGGADQPTGDPVLRST